MSYSILFGNSNLSHATLYITTIILWIGSSHWWSRSDGLICKQGFVLGAWAMFSRKHWIATQGIWTIIRYPHFKYECQGSSHTSAGMHILILWLFSWFQRMWPSRDDHQLNVLQSAKNVQKWYNCESITIPLLVPRNNSDSLLIFCCQKLYITFSSCFAVKVALSLSWYQKPA